MRTPERHTVVGMMSGSSLDGLDICLCQLWEDDGWHHRILRTTTIPYQEDWVRRLRGLNGVRDRAIIEEADLALGQGRVRVVERAGAHDDDAPSVPATVPQILAEAGTFALIFMTILSFLQRFP